MWVPGNDYYEGLIADGAIEQLTELEISSEIFFPDRFALYPNYPNPFNPLTNITYDIKSNSHVKVNIANIKGNHIRYLINEYQFSGTHSVLWNGRDDNGNPVPSGIYFYTMTVNKYRKSNKMILMK